MGGATARNLKYIIASEKAEGTGRQTAKRNFPPARADTSVQVGAPFNTEVH